MASEKVFRELLCESRSHPVESTDPNRARAIDELKRQLRETKAELEGERTKARQLQAQCERDIRKVKEESDKKLSASLEALSIRKEQERVTDVRRVEERLRKEWEGEIRVLEARKNEELSRAQRKWQHDKDDEIRRIVRDERELLLKDMSFEADEPSQKEEKLTRELFQLSQQNATLEDQVYNLSRENRVQIEQLRRMKHEHELEIADIVRQHQTEASRDYAQLRLAEQILAEREQDLHLVENKAERDRLEKEQLAEEMAAMKSVLSTSVTEPVESPQSSRRSTGGVLQRRMEDLEAALKKLEEEKSNFKLENASLRKKLVQDTSSEGKTTPKEEEKTRKLRKRNAELVALVKTLDEKCKSLKSDYEQLQKSSPSDSEQQLRKSLNRQHAKDIMDYTKQIHSKDREIGDLKRRIAKLEVNSKPPSESAPELENKVKVMAMDRLKMEKLLAKLCSQLPEEHEVTALSRTELECEVACVEALDLENQTLKRELAALQGKTEQVDAPEGPSDQQAEVARLRKFESEALSLRQELEQTNSLNSDLEQRCHVLTQQLEVSQLAVKELQSNADHVTSLEREVQGLTRELQSHKDRADQATKDCDRANTELCLLRDQLNSLHSDLEDRDRLLQERETLCQQLQTRRPSTEVGVQTIISDDISSDRRVNSDPLLTSPETSTPRVSGVLRETVRSNGVKGDLLDSSLDVEMKAAGVEITDPYDSSEGAGFSDLSTHSLESLKNDKSDGVTVVTAIPDQMSRVEASKVEEKRESEDDDEDPFHEQSPGPSLYIAKFSYSPAEQSPNPIYDMELPLTAGDYVYVYGDMDGDGFYHGRLVSGASGLVPSNFVERVTDGDAPPPRRTTHRRLSNLQDIEEVDEDSSESEEQVELTPPTDLEVQRQFVDGDSTSVALHWTAPQPCPPQLTGYSVYVNGERRLSVEGLEECTALVSDVPLTKLVRITVRSKSNGGESMDNATPVVLNPQYPDPPHNILVTSLDSPTSLLVHFSPHPRTLASVTRYTLYLNQHICTQLEATESTAAQQTISMLVLPRDVLQLESELSSVPSIKLTITASNEDFESVPSQAVDVAKQQLDHLMTTKEYSTEKREQDLQLRQSTPMESSNGGHVTTDASHVTGEAGHVINGVADSPVEEEPHKVRYYRALYSYDPHQQSPNMEYADEELAFQEGDVITSVSGMDVDGFFEGSLRGRHGMVPSNMVELIVDSEALAEIEHSVNDVVHSNGRPQTPPLDNGPQVLKAVADYDPALDSPNENSELELTFSEGELITVYGAPDEDGFYQGELKGKKGLVPRNFVETPTETDRDMTDNRKTKLISSQDTGIDVNLTHSD